MELKWKILIFILTAVLIFVVVTIVMNRGESQSVEHFAYTPNNIHQHMDYIDDLLTANGIKHWLFFDSLVNAVGHNNITNHPFEMGVNMEDDNKIMALNNKIELDGYQFIKTKSFGYMYMDTTGFDDVSNISITVRYNGIDFGNLYLYKKYSDGLMRRYRNTNETYYWPSTTYPAWFTDELVTVKVRGRFYPIPRDAEVLLNHWYGKNWKSPKSLHGQPGEWIAQYNYVGQDELKLSTLTDYLATHYNVNVKPDFKDCIKFVFPEEQVKWIEKNEFGKK